MDVRMQLAIYAQDVRTCTRCRAHDLLHEHPRHAFPVLQRDPTGVAGVIVVGEAPNHSDTYDVDKGYLTYEIDTDPTGRFMRRLLLEEVGLRVEDVLFTNAVLCLPARRRERHPIKARQREECRPWLARMIVDTNPSVVVTIGAQPLRAVGGIERHGLTLRNGAGRLHAWMGRQLLPLYHPGVLGRIARREAQQRQDIRALAVHLRERGVLA